jgi:hypothetical protein
MCDLFLEVMPTVGSEQSVRQSDRNQMHLTLSLLLTVVILYIGLTVAYLRPRDVIENLDFWYHIDLGRNLNWSKPGTLVDGLYPLGYPFLLRIAIDNRIDALRIGQLLSWVGGLLSLIAVFGIGQRATGSAWFAFVGAMLLVTNFYFLSYAAYEGNDMLAAGLQILSVYLLWLISPTERPTRFRPIIFAAGLVLGLAYLVRYTSLILFPCALLYVLWKTGNSARQAITSVGLLISGFLLVASVQIVPSIIVYHQPFYSQQAKNVWFGIYGQGDFVNNWAKMPNTVSLLEVIAIDPDRFIDHWWEQFSSAFVSPQLWLWPMVLHVAWLLGSVVLLSDKRLHFADRMLVMLALLGPIALTAMAWLTSRFMLLSLAVQALVIALLAAWGATLIPVRRSVQISLVLLMMTAVVALTQFSPMLQWLKSPVRIKPNSVNSFLRAVGMQDPREVATNDPYLHATDIPERTRYSQAYFFVANPRDVNELLTHPAASNWRYLVLDYKNGFGDYRRLRDATVQAKPQLIPLKFEESTAIFCVSPCLFNDIVSDQIVFDNGMKLIGHRLQANERGMSLYLYWYTDKPLDVSYKVSVRILDSYQRLVFQLDGVPQLWTYPTINWKPRDPVVDFYYLETEAPCTEGCQLALVVYEEQSLVPVLARTASGERIGPVIILQQLSE